MRSILYLLGITIILSACTKNEPVGFTTGSIAGSVSDKTTGEPVATVNVSLSPGGQSTVTGSDGTFNFPELEAGEYVFAIRKKGYLSHDGKFIVIPGMETPVHLLIERIPAKVSVDKDTLDFGSTKNLLSFQIVNSAYGELEWTIVQSCSWVKEIQPFQGTLGYGKTETITVTIDRDSLKAGQNTNTLIATTSDGGTEITLLATGATTPLLKTLEATDVNPNAGTAILNGEIIENGEPAYTERGFVYGTTKNPTLNDTKVVVQGSSLGEFSAKVSQLTAKTDVYYFRAYATNQTGTAYGENMEIPMQYITIKAASLAVQRSDLGKVNWSSAISMCHGSTAGGFSDWRLPTYDEVMTLYSNRKSIGELSERKDDSFYWTSSYTYVEEKKMNYVYMLNFRDGNYYWTPETDAINGSELWYVRCVRTLK